MFESVRLWRYFCGVLLCRYVCVSTFVVLRLSFALLVGKKTRLEQLKTWQEDRRRQKESRGTKPAVKTSVDRVMSCTIMYTAELKCWCHALYLLHKYANNHKSRFNLFGLINNT